jgi:hypothetical protein
VSAVEQLSKFPFFPTGRGTTTRAPVTVALRQFSSVASYEVFLRDMGLSDPGAWCALGWCVITVATITSMHVRRDVV